MHLCIDNRSATLGPEYDATVASVVVVVIIIVVMVVLMVVVMKVMMTVDVSTIVIVYHDLSRS